MNETLFKIFLYSSAAVGYLNETFLNSIDLLISNETIAFLELHINGFLSITLNIYFPAILAAYIPYIWGNAAIKLKNPVIKAIKTVKTDFESYGS